MNWTLPDLIAAFAAFLTALAAFIAAIAALVGSIRNAREIESLKKSRDDQAKVLLDRESQLHKAQLEIKTQKLDYEALLKTSNERDLKWAEVVEKLARQVNLMKLELGGYARAIQAPSQRGEPTAPLPKIGNDKAE